MTNEDSTGIPEFEPESPPYQEPETEITEADQDEQYAYFDSNEHLEKNITLEEEEAMVVAIKKRIKGKASRIVAEDAQLRTISRVLPSVRKGREEYFNPKIISIGPFHRRDARLRPMMQTKLMYLEDLLRRSNDKDILHKYIRMVKRSEARVRETYSERICIGSEDFVEMMVVDGCFVIEFLIKNYIRDIKLKQLREVNWNLPLLRNDLLLLENQIPFFILRKMFKLTLFCHLPDTEKRGNVPVTLTKLAICYVGPHNKSGSSVLEEHDSKKVHHLLHLYHLSLRPEASVARVRKTAGTIFCCGVHRADEERVRAPRMIPSATELQRCGVKFKKKWNGKASPLGLLDVNFRFRDGVMEIPVLSINEDTHSQFYNLIAFEQNCPSTGSHFTSFAVLMNNLIDTTEDVAVLKRHGIIENKLGQDGEVADLFNNLSKGAYLNYEDHYLKELFKSMKAYSDVSTHRWRARLMDDYFGSPWSIISVTAAIFLLILTFLQTIYIVYPYYHQPNN